MCCILIFHCSKSEGTLHFRSGPQSLICLESSGNHLAFFHSCTFNTLNGARQFLLWDYPPSPRVCIKGRLAQVFSIVYSIIVVHSK